MHPPFYYICMGWTLMGVQWPCFVPECVDGVVDAGVRFHRVPLMYLHTYGPAAAVLWYKL